MGARFGLAANESNLRFLGVSKNKVVRIRYWLRVRWGDSGFRRAAGQRIRSRVWRHLSGVPRDLPRERYLPGKTRSRKKQNAGIMMSVRGRQAAGRDARAAMGSMGLACFALLVWKPFPLRNAVLVLVTELCVWRSVSVLIWTANREHWARSSPAICARGICWELLRRWVTMLPLARPRLGKGARLRNPVPGSSILIFPSSRFTFLGTGLSRRAAPGWQQPLPARTSAVR